MTEVLPVTVAQTARLGERILAEVDQVIVGKGEAVRLVLLGVLASGHVLIEDLPGLGKTLMARSVRRGAGPGVHPGPVHPGPAARRPARRDRATTCHRRGGSFRPGPIFTNLLLADEINRTPPKTQAALLEAMAEGQVSIDGVTHAAAAAVRRAGHRQPDRVRGHLPAARGPARPVHRPGRLGYLDPSGRGGDGRAAGWTAARPRPRRAQVVDAAELLAMRESVESVHLHDDLLAYVVALTAATRSHPQVTVGASAARHAGGDPAGPRPRRCWSAGRLRDARGRQGGRGTRAGAPAGPAAGDVGAAGDR